MQDLGQRRKLELKIDELLEARNPDIVELAKKAKAELKRSAYEAAWSTATEAEALYRPPLAVTKLICLKGKAPSMAQARRQVQQGIVKVDDVLLRDHRAVVTPDQKVTWRGDVIQGD